MSRTNERYAVLEEFTQGLIVWESPGERQYRMADAIVLLRQRADRAERIIAALWAPSEAVVNAGAQTFIDWDLGATMPEEAEAIRDGIRFAIRSAAAAAEREVDA